MSKPYLKKANWKSEVILQILQMQKLFWWEVFQSWVFVGSIMPTCLLIFEKFLLELYLFISLLLECSSKNTLKRRNNKVGTWRFLVKDYYCLTTWRFMPTREPKDKMLKEVGNSWRIGRKDIEINMGLYWNKMYCQAELWPLQKSYGKRIESNQNGWLS